MAPLGDDLGGWDSHHYRLHSGGLHHAGLRWSLLHRGQPKHGGPARLPSQQQLHGLSERCECSLTSVPAEDWKYYPMRSLDCTTPFYKHVVHVENSYRLSCCRIFEGETFTWEATLCRALCIYRFLRESLWELIYIKKQMHLSVFIPETQPELSFPQFPHPHFWGFFSLSCTCHINYLEQAS